MKLGAVWKEVCFLLLFHFLANLTYNTQAKRAITDDPRYDAVGSSSLREELFNTYLKAHDSSLTPAESPEVEPGEDANGDVHMDDEAEKERKRQGRKERAVKEREEKIKAERTKVEADIGRSRLGLNKEEDDLEFRCAAYLVLLVHQSRGATHLRSLY